MSRVETTIPADVLARDVVGRNLAGATLGEVLGAAPTALVFLRHYG